MCLQSTPTCGKHVCPAADRRMLRRVRRGGPYLSGRVGAHVHARVRPHDGIVEHRAGGVHVRPGPWLLDRRPHAALTFPVACHLRRPRTFRGGLRDRAAGRPRSVRAPAEVGLCGWHVAALVLARTRRHRLHVAGASGRRHGRHLSGRRFVVCRTDRARASTRTRTGRNGGRHSLRG